MNGSSALSGILHEMRGWARFLLPTTKYVAPYYPTPDALIKRMLDLADVGPKDTLFDLGCGDGRVLLAAAERGATAVGYELDPQMAAVAAANITASRHASRLRVVCGDAVAAQDVGNASVLALYMTESGNASLMRALGPRLRPGTKIVSYCWIIPAWEHNLVRVDTADMLSVFLYRAPGGGSNGIRDSSSSSSSSSSRGSGSDSDSNVYSPQ